MESYISIFDKNGSTVDDKLKQKLINLAQKYEVHDFVLQDPSQFLFWYDNFPEFKNICNVECAAFVAAMLSFGNRKQFIPKIREILEYSLGEGGIARWCLNGAKNSIGMKKSTKQIFMFLGSKHSAQIKERL